MSRYREGKWNFGYEDGEDIGAWIALKDKPVPPHEREKMVETVNGPLRCARFNKLVCLPEAEADPRRHRRCP